MEITIGYLKKVISEIEKCCPNSDDIILADLSFSNEDFKPFMNAKRLLLLKGSNGWENRTFLAHNGMGSHFTQKGKQSELKYIGYFDEDNFVFV